MDIYEQIDGVPSFTCQQIDAKRSEYCVLIPIINEGQRIANELSRAKANGVDRVADIIICDGGSTDGSTDIAKLRELGVNTLLVKTGSGKQGAQLRMGLHWAIERGYKGFVTIDGNDKDSIEDVPHFIEKLAQGYDFIQGSRFVKGGVAQNTPISRLIAVKLLHAPIISLTARRWYTDTTNAYRGYSLKYLTHPECQPFRDIFVGYELLAYLSVKADQLGLKTCEIPVKRIYPPVGGTPTKISPLRGNYNLLSILFKNLFHAYDA